MANFWLNPLKEVAKCIFTEALLPSIKPHIDYWWRFDGNIQGLRDEIECLTKERCDMERKMNEARLNAGSATTDYEDWSRESTRKIEEATRILRGCEDLKVWKIIPRYLVGKSAKETAQGLAKLRNVGNSITIADPALPASEVSISRAPTLEFQSRRRIEEDIIKSLKDGNVRMIAICGTGGVGKTTMARRIEHKVREEKLFDEVVFVVVSQPIDLLKIQKQIAEILCLGLSEDTLAGRAHKLRTRLMDSKKKLIIFDDVWKNFDPKEIGVPYEGCKIILTSRDKDVCQEMEADKVIEVEVLDKEESWALFREKCGDCVDDLDLHSIAEKVAQECKGLPIALVTVGKALKGKNKNSWKDALSQLRNANPRNFPPLLKGVYMPVKLSYDFLETQSEKDLFLLCCLFPEDYEIRIEDLALISFGLGLFEEINSIEDGRNRTSHLLERLQSRFLLMTGMDEEYVKMHDVVRDVAIFIGSKEKLPIGFLKMDVSSKESSHNCNWMSLGKSIANAKLPNGPDFPNLRFLMILNSSDEGFDVNDTGFKGMEELRVLYFSDPNLQSLPSSLKFLKTLRKLHLEGCDVTDMSVVGELSSLETLRVWSCDSIEELPADVGKLKFLRLLELKQCRNLRRIVCGVISSLVALEELKIMGNVSEEKNASISELESLRNLTLLQIDLHDPNLIYEEIGISQQLVRYHIGLGRNTNWIRQQLVKKWQLQYEREVELCLPSGIIMVGNWIRQLVKNTQSLRLEGDGSNYFKLGEIESLRQLVLTDCSTVEKLFHCKFPMELIIDGRIPAGSNPFKHLESLNISDCPNLRYLFPIETQSITEASVLIEFPKLKKLSLTHLPKLVALAQGVEITNFPQLIDLEINDCPMLRTKIGKCPKLQMIQKLRVDGCDTIEEIFWDDDDDDGNRHIIFPELKRLELSNLPCLTTFYRGVESIKFPNLTVMSIGNLPRLSSLLAMDSEHTQCHHQSLHYFCNQKVEIIGLEELHLYDLPDKISELWCRHIPISFFHNLRWMSIFNVNGIINTIPSSLAKALVNLKSLWICFCKGIVDVMEDESTHDIVFPNLQYLYIRGNCKLRSFCQWKHDFELPSLKNVEIVDCLLMETFTFGSLSTPKLEKLSINSRVYTEMKDLNSGIHHFTTENANKDEYDEDDK